MQGRWLGAGLPHEGRGQMWELEPDRREGVFAIESSRDSREQGVEGEADT